jgi:hypothetical protein
MTVQHHPLSIAEPNRTRRPTAIPRAHIRLESASVNASARRTI